jgi:multisubunit Na+/H+ antiporter MnhG subunit
MKIAIGTTLTTIAIFIIMFASMFSGSPGVAVIALCGSWLVLPMLGYAIARAGISVTIASSSPNKKNTIPMTGVPMEQQELPRALRKKRL